MKQTKNDTGLAAEVQLIFSSQEETEYFPGTVPDERACDEDAEAPSLEPLIEAVLNSNAEQVDAVESLDEPRPQQQFIPLETQFNKERRVTMTRTKKNTLKAGSIGLGLALMLTTICYSQEGPPHNVIYWNGDSSNQQTQNLGYSYYTDVIVNFVTPDPSCNLGTNGNLPGDIGASIQTLHNAGKTVLVSFGGSTVASANYAACANNVQQLGNQLVNIVKSNGFDGVDIDFEDDNGFQGKGSYDGMTFLISLTGQLYRTLPRFQNIITHAPEDVYWTPSYNNAYMGVYQNTKGEIAWFNIQTYNNCPNGVSMDCNAQEKIAAYQSLAKSVPSIKLVVGVPVSSNAATDGYIPLTSGDGNNMTYLISQLQQQYPNQFGGLMGWNYLNDVNHDSGKWGLGLSNALADDQRNWVGYNGVTGQCLELDDTTVSTKPCNGGNSQNWMFYVNNIRLGGQCLDSNANGNVYAGSCNGGNFQNWQFFAVPGGIGETIRDRATGRCLNSDSSGNVTTQTCSGAGSQTWYPKH